MIKKGIIIDPIRNTIERECSYDDKRVEGMYYKVDSKDLIPVAYIYPIENREAVKQELDKIAAAKKVYDDISSNIFYKVLPTLR